MSKIKVNANISHLPSFREYEITANDLEQQLDTLGLDCPMGMLDWTYYFTDMEGWGKVLSDLAFKSDLYSEDKFDCENYALKAMSICAERYGLNTFALVIGDMPLGRHGFNMLYTGAEFLLWEPNGGFECSGQAFPIGEFGYKPKLVLI